ncbi:TlpA disulfide reductase family protein [Halorhabdus sp. BNX81]|uniref:TlpA family protein disulfide reductase n=1 Tax=Halorhabdus sp. BNX81 TaxID=2980181 RepID=UPI0023DD54D5|nr:TlpA disulfide reductase family protein [Halorhabdus sp. BNX81]WEL21665.1 Thioredoxin [Halorhabdus sp. BNX81]
MRRRDLLAGVGGAAVVGAGGYLAVSTDDGRIDPVAVDTFETPNSAASELRVPVEGQVTVVDLFATWCQPCKPALDALRTVQAETTDIAFVSVTNEVLGGELSRDDVLAWWDAYGGAWPVGHDPEGSLLASLGASTLPYTAVVDPNGRVVWAETGVPDPERVSQAIDDARP